jgi:hypothetical protein
MKIGVIGSRTIDAADAAMYIREFMDSEEIENFGTGWTFISGAADGVDEAVRFYCKEANHDHVRLKPYHMLDKHVEFSAKYYFKRNKQIMDNSDFMILLHDPIKDDEVISAWHYTKSRDIPYKMIEVWACDYAW